MALPSQTFTNIIPERFEALAAKVQRAIGVTVSGNIGTATQKGYTLTWTYDQVAETLTIQCLKKPLIVPAEAVQGKIRSLMESANG
jgi:hypothetical protein